FAGSTRAGVGGTAAAVAGAGFAGELAAATDGGGTPVGVGDTARAVTTGGVAGVGRFNPSSRTAVAVLRPRYGTRSGLLMTMVAPFTSIGVAGMRTDPLGTFMSGGTALTGTKVMINSPAGKSRRRKLPFASDVATP